jgi:hypothetical protein
MLKKSAFSKPANLGKEPMMEIPVLEIFSDYV